MKNKQYFIRTLSVVLAVLSAVCAAVVISAAVIPSFRIRLFYYIFSALAAPVFCVAAAALKVKASDDNQKKKKTVQNTVTVLFVFYIVLLAAALLMGVMYANHTPFVLRYNKYWLRDALPALVPFSSVTRLFGNLISHNTSAHTFFLNFGGNLLLYSPFALFMPAFSKYMRRFDSFLPFIVFLIVSVEVAQGMFCLGSCEIDDFLLGVTGTCAVYFILKIKPISAFLEKSGIYR